MLGHLLGLVIVKNIQKLYKKKRKTSNTFGNIDTLKSIEDEKFKNNKKNFLEN